MLKLNFYGIKSKTKKWTEYLLSNITQYVVVKDKYSYSSSVTLDVPKGSVIGPSLFILNYTDNLGNAIKSRVHLFAGDTIL